MKATPIIEGMIVVVGVKYHQDSCNFQIDLCGKFSRIINVIQDI